MLLNYNSIASWNQCISKLQKKVVTQKYRHINQIAIGKRYNTYINTVAFPLIKKSGFTLNSTLQRAISFIGYLTSTWLQYWASILQPITTLFLHCTLQKLRHALCLTWFRCSFKIIK